MKSRYPGVFILPMIPAFPSPMATVLAGHDVFRSQQQAREQSEACALLFGINADGSEAEEMSASAGMTEQEGA